MQILKTIIKKNFKPETSPVTLYNPRVMSIEYSHKKPL